VQVRAGELKVQRFAGRNFIAQPNVIAFARAGTRHAAVGTQVADDNTGPEWSRMS